GLEVRPTTDRVKEGLFSVLASRLFIQNCTILDLFAGSGSLGYEALSRGARSVSFVDYNRKNIQQIEKLAREFELTEKIRTLPLTVEKFLEGPPVPYDIIFADPPYHHPSVDSLPEVLFSGNWLNKGGWLVLEHDKHHNFDDHPHFKLHKEYGRTYVSFFQAAPASS